MIKFSRQIIKKINFLNKAQTHQTDGVLPPLKAVPV